MVATRHGHDGAGAIPHEHIVGDPDRNLLAGNRVGGGCTDVDAGLLAGGILAVDVVLGSCGFAISGNGIGLFWRGQFIDQRVFGRQHHEGCAEQRVGSGREHGDWPGGAVEVHGGTFGAANPVALHGLDRVGPIEQLKVVGQTVGVLGDTHHPLAHVALEDGEVASVAAVVGGDFLVGYDGAQTGAPVHGSIGHVGQAVAIDYFGLLGS